MNISKSDVVLSINGRDVGRQFLVIEIEDGYAFIADGKTRRQDKPKRKKLKHLQFVRPGDSWTAEKLENGVKLTNNEIRRALSAASEEDRGERGGM